MAQGSPHEKPRAFCIHTAASAVVTRAIGNTTTYPTQHYSAVHIVTGPLVKQGQIGASVSAVAACGDSSMSLKTLLVDNYDSYTYNLFQLISEVNGGKAGTASRASSGALQHTVSVLTSCLTVAVAPDVITNDQCDWPALSDILSAGTYDNIVVSPGPGTPDCAKDIGETEQASCFSCSLKVHVIKATCSTCWFSQVSVQTCSKPMFNFLFWVFAWACKL